MHLRDAFGTLFSDEDFTSLFPTRGQPALAPWRLALVTVFQFLENLTDRQAADAVRGRVDWKYALSLELDDHGFDFSVLSEFRDRLIAGNSEQLLFDKLLEHSKAKGLIRERGKQRTDSTYVLANLRVMNRAELVGETLWAALNELAEVDPGWLHDVAQPEWFERYRHRVEEYRLPKSKAARDVYVLTGGNDGFALLDALDKTSSEKHITLDKVQTLRAVWDRHYERKGDRVRWREGAELSWAAQALESPYDPEAKYSAKRGREWVGYKVHVTESCAKHCPHSKTSASWKQHHQAGRYPRDLVKVRFATADCRARPLRERCTRSPSQAKSLNLQPEAAFEALRKVRAYIASPKDAKLTAFGQVSRAPCLKT